MPKRVTINLSEKLYERIVELASHNHIKPAEAFRLALDRGVFFSEQHIEQNTIILKKDDTEREVVLTS